MDNLGRRAMLIQQGDIPNSATAWYGQTAQSPYGNVFYIPFFNGNRCGLTSSQSTYSYAVLFPTRPVYNTQNLSTCLVTEDTVLWESELTTVSNSESRLAIRPAAILISNKTIGYDSTYSGPILSDSSSYAYDTSDLHQKSLTSYVFCSPYLWGTFYTNNDFYISSSKSVRIGQYYLDIPDGYLKVKFNKQTRLLPTTAIQVLSGSYKYTKKTTSPGNYCYWDYPVYVDTEN